jgi:Fe-S cluster assembly iron-binding protein IscA
MLVTVSPEATPHVGTVLVGVDRKRLVVRVGERTRGHIRANPSVTLTWLRADNDYQLILDGVAVVVDDAPAADELYAVEIDVRRGILHRVAGRTEGPTCRALGVVAAP